MRRALTATIALALLVSAAIPVVAQDVAAAGSAPAIEDPFANLKESRALTGPVAAKGKVTLPNGAPAKGAIVYLSAWPSSDDLASLAVGDPLDLQNIGWVKTDKKGNYVLRIDPAIDLEEFRSSAGSVDLDVVTVSDAGWSTFSFSLVPEELAPSDDITNVDKDRMIDPTVSTYSLSSGAVIQPVEVDLQLGRIGGAHLASSVDVAEDVTLAAASAPAQTAVAAAVSQGKCPGGPGVKADLGDRWTLVGAIHIAASGKRMKFTYSGSASSSLGIGISATGAFGTYSTGGTVSRNRSFGVTYPWYTSTTHRYLDTLFSYEKYCRDIVGGGYMYHQYEARPTRHEGGTQTRSISAPAINNSYCVAYTVPGSGGYKSSTDTITWSNGVNISGAIGIGLSSRTGYRTDSKQEWIFDTAGRLCGTHDKPAGTPRRLIMAAP